MSNLKDDTLADDILKYPRTVNVFQQWDASTNIPEIKNTVGKMGQIFEVGTEGNTIINGQGNWKLGDILVFVTDWEPVRRISKYRLIFENQIHYRNLAKFGINDHFLDLSGEYTKDKSEYVYNNSITNELWLLWLNAVRSTYERS